MKLSSNFSFVLFLQEKSMLGTHPFMSEGSSFPASISAFTTAPTPHPNPSPCPTPTPTLLTQPHSFPESSIQLELSPRIHLIRASLGFCPCHLCLVRSSCPPTHLPLLLCLLISFLFILPFRSHTLLPLQNLPAPPAQQLSLFPKHLLSYMA